MKVERETAGFALPFAAGVLLASYSGYSIYSSFTGSPVIALTAAILCVMALMHPARRQAGPAAVWLLAGAAAFMSGAFCALTSEHLSISHTKAGISIWAEGFGLRMQEAIDSLPFTDQRCNAISKALITGERSSVPREMTEAFRDSGASHILALSGLHLGIIYSIIRRALTTAGNSRRIWIPRSIVIILACGAYTLATGAGPSIVRAFLFILLAETARLTHRHHSTRQILFSALIIQLVISPSSVRSAGFQLSYAAMSGIAFILPHLRAVWPGKAADDSITGRCMRGIWNGAAMSISCQLATAPLAYHHFGTFPRHFLLTNLIALPLAGLIIPSILASLAMHIIGICPDFMIRITEFLITTLIRSLEIIATM